MKLAMLISTSAAFPEAALKQTCALAGLLAVPLTGIATTEDSIHYYSGVDGNYIDLVSASIANAEHALEEAEQRFNTGCDAASVAHAWHGSQAFMRHEWPKYSPYFDLAVAPPPFSAPELACLGVSAMLQLQEDAQITTMDGRCLIAWDGSLQAARAVRAALPLLDRFDRVEVIAIDPPQRSMPYDIGGYLAGHGISAVITTETSAEASVASLINSAASGADLLVMGAYGYSATLEKIFGGVTEKLRQESLAPVLFAH